MTRNKNNKIKSLPSPSPPCNGWFFQRWFFYLIRRLRERQRDRVINLRQSEMHLCMPKCWLIRDHESKLTKFPRISLSISVNWFPILVLYTIQSLILIMRFILFQSIFFTISLILLGGGSNYFSKTLSLINWKSSMLEKDLPDCMTLKKYTPRLL